VRKIQVLGPGCPRCRRLAENAEAAVREAGLPCEVEKVTDLDEMLAFGILATPALVVDGEVKVSGKVLSPDEIRGLLA
jgi:small redox-active disulfide protein 2